MLTNVPEKVALGCDWSHCGTLLIPLVRGGFRRGILWFHYNDRPGSFGNFKHLKLKNKKFAIPQKRPPKGQTNVIKKTQKIYLMAFTLNKEMNMGISAIHSLNKVKVPIHNTVKIFVDEIKLK